MFQNINDLNASALPRRRGRVDAERFLQLSAPSNLLVNGGGQQLRQRLLLHELRLREGVSVVLTSSPEVPQMLIEAASSGQLNRTLYVCSEQHPNYDPLYGMGAAAAAAFLADVAEMLGYRDRSTMISYFAAFSELYARQNEEIISLRGLYTFSKTPAIELARLASATDEALYLDLTESAAGAKPLRDILTLLHREFSGFTSASCLSLLSAATAKPCIICIRPSGQLRLLGKLFAAELEAVMEEPLQLLLCESMLLNEKPFAEALNKKKQSERGTVSLFCENLVGFPDSDLLLKNLPRKIILLDGQVDAEDLQTVLTSLGTAPRFLKMNTISKQMKLPFEIGLKEAKTRGYGQMVVPRALYIELLGNEAVLASPATDLIVAKHLVV